MYIGATALLTGLSLLLFALAIRRHHRQAFGSLPPRSRVWTLRAIGTITLCAAPVPWIVRDGLGMGLVTWSFCALPLVAMFVVLMLAYMPHQADRTANAPGSGPDSAGPARPAESAAGQSPDPAVRGSRASSGRAS